MNRRTIWLSMGLKFTGAVIGLVGVVFSVWDTTGLVNGFQSLLFFTLQSNIWIICIMILFGINDIYRLKTGRRFLNEKWHRVKFVFTISLMLTFFVFGLLLLPAVSLDYSLSITSICLHFLAPIIAIVDYALFDYRYSIGRQEVLLALIPPLYYVFFVFACILIGIRFPPDGSMTPYFFMDYETFGWFTISRLGIGVVYWFAFLFLFVLTLAFLLRGLSLAINRKMTRKSPLINENC